MVGYVCKIVMEDTHPPVWRRVVVPERITFREMHEIIQILFGWEDMHLHGFEIPADHICIDEEEDFWGDHYTESETLIDSFFKNYKWVRYTYDFGDDWRHRINIERIDEEYSERYATLLKAKGDNFIEDCGGRWETDDDTRMPFDWADVEQQLKKKELKYHEELEEEPLLKETLKSLQNLIQSVVSREKAGDFQHQFKNLLQAGISLKSEMSDEIMADNWGKIMDETSDMMVKVDQWKQFDSEQERKTVAVTKSSKTQLELMGCLGEKEASDYYKYLRLPPNQAKTREEKITAVSNALKFHPEYLCYILDKDEYQSLEKLMKSKEKNSTDLLKKSVAVIKIIGLGLADFSIHGNQGELSLASDIEQYISVLDAKNRKKIYKKLQQMDERFGSLIQIYGVLEMDNAYDMYLKSYDLKQEEEEFTRFIYWHLRFNNMVDTFYELNGTCYVASKELDAKAILEKRVKYCADISYREYADADLQYLSDDLAHRSEWMDILFCMLRDQFQMNDFEAQDFLIEIVIDICNGVTLNQLMGKLENVLKKYWSLENIAELWQMVSGLMLEMELPILKGRTRLEYAEEKGISPWSVGMLDDSILFKNTKACHIYHFPAEIQEWVYEAVVYDVEKYYEQLLDYKKKNQICSEEFLYLLTDSALKFQRQGKDMDALIRELRQSSFSGKQAAKLLEAMNQLRDETEDADWSEGDAWNYMNGLEIQTPYVRTEPKIGRNDPCPCGSGKKYKKCCGR